MTSLSSPNITIKARRGDISPEVKEDRIILKGEVDWLLEGPSEKLDQIEASLAGLSERFGKEVLSISFGNCIGLFDIPELGRVEVVSGKWDRAHFEWMLSDLSQVASALPFSAATGGALPYDRSVVSREDVVYHSFVYLRHILSDDCPRQDKLLSALQGILREPHRRLERKTYSVPIEASRKIEPAALVQMVSGSLVEVSNRSALQTPLAVALGGRLPERIEETRAELSLDTPENRFVKAFLNFAMGVIKATEEAFSEAQTVFTRGVSDDCATMARKLHPVIRNSLWSEVGEMVHVPASSTVLQRRRGYKEVFQHFTKLRLANRIPLEKDELFHLLEVKDIALLYEIWTFFALTKQLTQLLGSPVSAGRPRPTPAEIKVPWDLEVVWENRTRLLYNPSFSRSRPSRRRSYSVRLRPDIALETPEGSNAGLHLMDAKFRLRKLDQVMPEGEDEELAEKEGERRGEFKKADLYKMHTYRDAIPRAKSVWILYPGDQARFFSIDGSVTTGEFDSLTEEIEGVGALPLVPTEEYPSELRAVLEHLVSTN